MSEPFKARMSRCSRCRGNLEVNDPDAFGPPGRMAGQQNGRVMSRVVAAGCRNREGHTF